jgi:hypothetical protein
MIELVFVQANATGCVMGDSHPRTRWPRATVDRALAMRAAGRRYREIRDELGVAHSTLHSWFTGRRRRQPDRIIVKRVKQRDSFGMNHQRAVVANVDQPRFSEETSEQVIAPADEIPTNLPSEGND